MIDLYCSEIKKCKKVETVLSTAVFGSPTLRPITLPSRVLTVSSFLYIRLDFNASLRSFLFCTSCVGFLLSLLPF